MDFTVIPTQIAWLVVNNLTDDPKLERFTAPNYVVKIRILSL